MFVTENLITNFKGTQHKKYIFQSYGSACHLLVLNICTKLYEYILQFKSYRADTILSQKLLRTKFKGDLCSACPPMLVNIYIKFHEDILSCFQVTEGTRFCDRQTDRQQTGQKQYCLPTLKGGDIIILKYPPYQVYCPQYATASSAANATDSPHILQAKWIRLQLKFWQWIFHLFWAESVVRCGENGRSLRKTPDHPQAELGLSHVTRARLKPTVVRWQVI